MFRIPEAFNYADVTLRDEIDKVMALIPLIKTTGFAEIKPFVHPATTCETWMAFLSAFWSSRHFKVWKESVKKLPKSISLLEQAK